QGEGRRALEKPAAACLVMYPDAHAQHAEGEAPGLTVEACREPVAAQARTGDRTRGVAAAQHVIAAMAVGFDLVAHIAFHEGDDALARVADAPCVRAGPGRMRIGRLAFLRPFVGDEG